LPGRDAARRFHFMREIASGGFGSVHLAKVVHADGFSRIVAVKLLKSQWTDSEEIARRMRDEARLLGLLRHRHIVDVLDLTSIDGRVAVIMEYLEAVDLRCVTQALTAADERMSARAALEITYAVAAALDAAYNRPPMPGDKPLRVIHRDIKPSNVMLDDTGMVKVLDFGVARSEIENRESHTQELQFGSIEYMAPERLFFEPETPASDVYALGATLYELLSRERLGKPKGRPALHHARVVERVSALRAVLDLPAEQGQALEEMICGCLAFDHQLRPTSSELAQQARALARQMPGEDLSCFSERLIPPLLTSAQTGQTRTTPLDDSIVIEDSLIFTPTGSRERPKDDDAESGLFPRHMDLSIGERLRRGALAELAGDHDFSPRPATGAPAPRGGVRGGADPWYDGPTSVGAPRPPRRSRPPAPLAPLISGPKSSVPSGPAPAAPVVPPGPRVTPVPPRAPPAPPPLPDTTLGAFEEPPAHPVVSSRVVEPLASAQLVDPLASDLVTAPGAPAPPPVAPPSAPLSSAPPSSAPTSRPRALPVSTIGTEPPAEPSDFGLTAPLITEESPRDVRPPAPALRPVLAQAEPARVQPRHPAPQDPTPQHPAPLSADPHHAQPRHVEPHRAGPQHAGSLHAESLRDGALRDEPARGPSLPPTAPEPISAIGETFPPFEPEPGPPVIIHDDPLDDDVDWPPRRRSSAALALGAGCLLGLGIIAAIAAGLYSQRDTLRALAGVSTEISAEVLAEGSPAEVPAAASAAEPASAESAAPVEGGIQFVSHADDTAKIKVRCEDSRAKGATSAALDAEAVSNCTVTAYMSDRSRLTAVVGSATVGVYDCFVSGESACTRQP